MQTDKKPRVLVTGSDGQLGRMFRRISHQFPDMEYLWAGKLDFDITVKSREAAGLKKLEVDAVVNCAAYTNVEKAESEPEESMLVNATAAGFLADACHEAQCLLVHFSTDYVFDGKKTTPYTEKDLPRPLSVYGESKLLGEHLIDEKLRRHLILRTSWLYSEYGHNFFKTMMRLAREKGELHVVNDQVASPTYAGSLAGDVLAFLQRAIVRKEHVEYGLYHYSENGEASWWHFAKEIMKQNGMDVPVHAISTSSTQMKARRPAYSKLDNSKWIMSTGQESHSWQEGLTACLAEFSHTGNE